MDCLVINGGKRLSGTITVGGMKNAALPILFASILVGGKCVIENLPPISDVTTALEILGAMGAKIKMIKCKMFEILYISKRQHVWCAQPRLSLFRIVWRKRRSQTLLGCMEVFAPAGYRFYA